ncbi:MAG: ATP-dependent protease subunit HslV [Candidatus Mcinerneyibacterium aminivorans]|uniref:ATP-dependent protease subunit HslV n=1 Tax=Candidatus Mcinerneyibacterium aminivorans TaxID=2703815 RepID=A0A5D0MIH3_9BACT|nr:MAG: ATP-dependent protease subunit HslV [Candidatus Mcinerneyibacterium aminivorans]
MKKFEGTTILMVRKNKMVALGGDGQVTLGDAMVKTTAKKIRRVKDNIVVGFAGSVADSFALMERFESKLNKYQSNLRRASVELAKDWRSDKFLRKLEAMMIVTNKEESFILSGGGEVIEDEDGILAIGSGGNYAMAAARALKNNTDMNAEEIVKKSMKLASDICIYTNDSIAIEVIE